MEEVFLQKKYTMEEASSTLFFKWRKYCLKIDEDSSCKEEKVEDFVFKLEEVVETKVAYFYALSQKNWKVSDHDSNPSQTMTLTTCPVGRVP